VPWRRTIIAVESLVCLAAVEGAVQLFAGIATPPDSRLPFGLTNWVLPGLWLLGSVAAPSGAAALMAVRRSAHAPQAVLVASMLLVVELVVQIPFLGASWLQAGFTVVALAMAATARSALSHREQPRRSRLAHPTASVPNEPSIAFYWLPLGAGGDCVRLNGRVFEAIAAWHEHRRARDLYHSALEVRVDGARYVIEMAPVWNDAAPDRGAVCEGAVGSRLLGHSRWFRYEVRCWRDGHIPDLAEAVDSPQQLSQDQESARSLLTSVPSVPALVWGRDELGLGEMWNSNSLISWLLAQQGLVDRVVWPANGRAPGWDAGLRLAHASGGGGPLAQQRHQQRESERLHRHHEDLDDSRAVVVEHADDCRSGQPGDAVDRGERAVAGTSP